MISMTWKDPMAIFLGGLLGYVLLPNVNVESKSGIDTANAINYPQSTESNQWTSKVIAQVGQYFEQFIVLSEVQIPEPSVVVENDKKEQTLFIDNKHYVLVATFEKEKAYAVLKKIDSAQNITEDMLLFAINDHVAQYTITDIKRTNITLKSEENAPLVLQLFNLDEDSNDNEIR